MNELKRTFSAKIVLLLAILCLVSFSTELLMNRKQQNINREYEEVIEEYAAIPQGGWQQHWEEEQEERDRMLMAFWAMNETDPFFQKEGQKECRAIWGENYPEVLATMDLSREAERHFDRRGDALRHLKPQLDYLQSYGDYLDTVHANAERLARMSIFNFDAYSRRNTEKPAEITRSAAKLTSG